MQYRLSEVKTMNTKENAIKEIFALLTDGNSVKIKDHKYNNFGEISYCGEFAHFSHFGSSAVRLNIRNITWLVNTIFNYKNVDNIIYEVQ